VPSRGSLSKLTRYVALPGQVIPTLVGYVCGIIRNMTQPPESKAEPTTVTGQPRYDDRYDRPSRLSQVLAWVGIIAGVVFVVSL